MHQSGCPVSCYHCLRTTESLYLPLLLLLQGARDYRSLLLWHYTSIIVMTIVCGGLAVSNDTTCMLAVGYGFLECLCYRWCCLVL